MTDDFGAEIAYWEKLYSLMSRAQVVEAIDHEIAKFRRLRERLLAGIDERLGDLSADTRTFLRDDVTAPIDEAIAKLEQMRVQYSGPPKDAA